MANKRKTGKRYSEERIVLILSEVEQGNTLAETSRKYGVSEQTIRNWRTQYRDMGLEEIRELCLCSRLVPGFSRFQSGTRGRFPHFVGR